MAGKKGKIQLSKTEMEEMHMTNNDLTQPTENFRNYILSLQYDRIGSSVLAGNILDEILSDLTAICRRCFKKKDVVIYVDTDDEDEMENGIVFTSQGIVSWRMNGNEIHQIPYDKIESVDYDDDEVIIHYAGVSESIYLGEDAEEEKYPRYMYNFIMDILEYDESVTAPEYKEQNSLQIHVPGFLFPDQQPMDIDLSSYSKCQAVDVLEDILKRYRQY